MSFDGLRKSQAYAFKTPDKWIFGYNLVAFVEIFPSIIAEI